MYILAVCMPNLLAGLGVQTDDRFLRFGPANDGRAIIRRHLADAGDGVILSPS